MNSPSASQKPLKPITRLEAEQMDWATLERITVTFSEARETKQVDIFSSIQEIRTAQQKRGETNT